MTRAAIAVALLAGFYVFAVAIVGGLAWVGFSIGHAVGGKMIIIAAIAGFIVLRAVFTVSRAHADDDADTARQHARVTPQDQPELWDEVTRLATVVGTRPPDEIHLVPEVNAAVTEDASWLGLRGGTRTMLIGTPLLVGLTADQLRAVLAHELGHYSRSHTRLGPLTYRGRVQIGRTVEGLRNHPILRRVFHGYALLFLLVSQKVSRDQEYEADLAAARLTSADALMSSLRELPVLGAAWEHYLEAYVGWAANAGVRPRAVVGGFQRMLTDDARATTLAQLREGDPEEKPSRFDSHPTFAQRKAALADFRPSQHPADDRPATVLLVNADDVMERATEAMLAEKLTSLPALPWEEITPLAGQAMVRPGATQAHQVATSLLGREATIDGVIGLLDDPSRFASALAESLGETVEPDVAAALLSMAVDAYLAAASVTSGRLSWRLNWGGDIQLVDFAGSVVDFAPSVRAAIEDADIAALRTQLGKAGVPGDAGIDSGHALVG